MLRKRKGSRYPFVISIDFLSLDLSFCFRYGKGRAFLSQRLVYPQRLAGCNSSRDPRSSGAFDASVLTRSMRAKRRLNGSGWINNSLVGLSIGCSLRIFHLQRAIFRSPSCRASWLHLCWPRDVHAKQSRRGHCCTDIPRSACCAGDLRHRIWQVQRQALPTGASPEVLAQADPCP